MEFHAASSAAAARAPNVDPQSRERPAAGEYAVNMRTSFHRDISWLEQRTAFALTIARDAIEQVAESLIEHDLALADAVIREDDRLDAIYLEIQNEMFSIIARQAPVAGDLRRLMAYGNMSTHIERMGDGCVNAAKMIKLAGPEIYPYDITARLAATAKDLLAMTDQAARAFADHNVELAIDLERLDDAIDDANRRVFQVAVGAEIPAELREWAGYMLLMARAFERTGDHIVDLGEQIAFVVTGEFREFTDASHEESLEHARSEATRQSASS